MNRKFLASIALFLILFTGVFSPVASLVSKNAGPRVAYAASTTAGTTTTTTVASNVDEITCGMNILCAIVTGYAGFVQFLPHLLAQVSGMLLDYTVWKNLESSTWTSQDTVDSFVVKGWKLIRDFSNLLFIFALFAVGFSLILNGSGTGFFELNPKRTIARVILMALLINFSFFMCRFIIEVTNLGANVFYSAITKVETDPPTQTVTTSENTSIDMGTSDEFYSQLGGIRSVSLGILSLTDAQKLILKSGDIKGTQQSAALGAISWYEYDWGVYILILFVSTITGIFNFFLVYLFLSSSIFLFARIYGLYFLIILSPIAFVSTTIPALQSKEYFGFDDWFKQLVGLAFSLPIYMFFMYLAIFFMKLGGSATGNGYITMAVFILAKLISAGFILVMGKKVAKDLSGKIGAMASNAVNGVVTGTAMIAGAAMTGGASAALRMGGGLARNAAINTASRVGEVVAGKDNVEAIRQRFSSGNFKSFNRLNNFNPLRGMGNQTTVSGGVRQLGKNLGAGLSEAARMSGSQLPDQAAVAFRTGKLTPRAESMARAREEREKKVKDIEFKNGLLKQQLKNPNLTQAERTALNKQIKENEKQIWNLNNPSPTAQNQQGTTGTNQPPVPPANPSQLGAQQNPASGTAQGGTSETNPPKPPTTNAAGLQGGGSGTAPASNKSVDASLVNNTANKSPLTPEQTKQVVTEIENEMRSLEKEMNNPATRLNKDRMRELESKYNGLDKERKGLSEGNVLPARLKSFAGQPVGQLDAKPKTFGQGRTDRSLTTDLNLTQQDRVLRKAVEKQERIVEKAAAQAKGISKAQSLLAGIAGGAAGTAATTSATTATIPTSRVEETGGFDQSGLIQIPGTMDFGGIQIPEAPGSGITQTISNIEIPLGAVSPAANIVGLGDKKISVGKAVDTVAKLDTPVTQFIPEVGPELAAAGKAASAIKSVGITEQPKTGIVDRFGNSISSGTNTKKFSGGEDLANSFFGRNFDTDSITEGFKILNQTSSTLDVDTTSRALDKINEGFSRRNQGAFMESHDDLKHLDTINNELEQLAEKTLDPVLKEKISNTQNLIFNTKNKWVA